MTSFFWSCVMRFAPPVTLPKTVHTIEVLRALLVEHDEELAATTVFSGVCHRERAWLVAVRIARRLALDLVAWAAGTDTRVARSEITRERVTALDDEPRDHAVKLDAVVEAGVRELLEVLDGLWSFLVVKLRGERTAVGLDCGFLRHASRRARCECSGKVARSTERRRGAAVRIA
jgi:hypothetical protein